MNISNTSNQVSIIIPTYNRANEVVRAIKSAQAQTYSNLEILVVDDFSSDDTAQQVTRLSQEDSRVKYIASDQNYGVAKARNIGLKAATGEYIAFLDSDDLWKPFKLALQVEILNRLDHVGLVWTEMDAINPNNKYYHANYLNKMYENYSRFSRDQLFKHEKSLAEMGIESRFEEHKVYWSNIYPQMIFGNLIHTSTVLFRHQVLKVVVGFDESLRYTGEDFDFYLRITRDTSVAFLDVSAIYYTIGNLDQLTHPSMTALLAENYIKTILPKLSDPLLCSSLTDTDRRKLLASAYQWAGVENLRILKTAKARAHFMHGLGQRVDFTTLIYFMLSLVPSSLLGLGIKIVRSLRRRFRRLRRRINTH